MDVKQNLNTKEKREHYDLGHLPIYFISQF